MSEANKQISLRFLQEGTKSDFTNWGHEYLSHLSNDIGEEFNLRLEQGQGCDDLIDLVREIVPYFMEHNAEHDAIDLLMEVDQIEDLAKVIFPLILQFVNETNFNRVI